MNKQGELFESFDEYCDRVQEDVTISGMLSKGEISRTMRGLSSEYPFSESGAKGVYNFLRDLQLALDSVLSRAGMGSESLEIVVAEGADPDSLRVQRSGDGFDIQIDLQILDKTKGGKVNIEFALEEDQKEELRDTATRRGGRLSLSGNVLTLNLEASAAVGVIRRMT